MKKPHSISYNQKNDIRPFEDVTKLEFFCKKNDSSLFMLGNHNKKRPHNMILGRMYDYHLLDMFELGLENFVSLQEFKNSKVTAGSKSCLLFAGEPFADPPIYGTAYDQFGGGPAGKRACEAISALVGVGAIDTMLSNFIRPLQELADDESRVGCPPSRHTKLLPKLPRLGSYGMYHADL